ncbi:hypothetical protein SETIT_1G013700v2 [Setaria italica]|uniref:RING-type E3 ubiquitin transferase n=2 Tax=Setaria TaxID=4554 RepID=K3YY03_SETIT|nr:RING-H2 finger protein ATL39 [Setaria italica]RCV04606.1 hypothetical protein SETIT_1G013700v2 [Setaria italica]TKW36921.1 hypothetical protein SEVIR_1G013600v2 [Setaria viridis]
MLNMYPRLQLQASSVDDGEDENVDDDGYSAFYGYGIAVVCVTIFVFCVLVSTVVSVWKACAFAILAALLLGAAGCYVPRRWFRRSGRRGAGAELVVVTVAAAGAVRPGYPCGAQVKDAPSAFAFQCPVEAGGGGGEAASASCVVCSVCLEDVRGGEMVRQVPACRHVFHVGCIDMWLHSHRTCPMCRCEVSPVAKVTTPKDAAAEEVALESSDDHELPPV